MERTNKQKLADTLRRKEYRGCTGQATSHGCGRCSIQIFAEDTVLNRARFPHAKPSPQGSLVVADFDI